jgi:glycosyltransferase involved in cell wall biosynthesis
MPEFSIVIPLYNEERRLPKTAGQIFDFFRTQNRPVEIIFVNDGSKDRTVEILEEYKKAHEFRVVSYDENRGKGYAVKQGALAAQGDWVIFFDIDLATPLEEFNRLLEARRPEDKIIIGSRRLENSQINKSESNIRTFLGHGFTKISNILVPGIKDFTCGFKCFSREAALKYCRAKGLNIRQSLADKIDYPDETFDVVFALDVLEHLENDEAAIKEINRILKTGGIFIATVPAHKFLWSYHDESLHHKRRYAKKEFEDLLGKQFKVSVVSWIHACIFLPTLIMRGAKKFFGKNTGGSDVKEINRFVNGVGKLCYAPELACFKFFGGLPFGVSLIGVAVKK